METCGWPFGIRDVTKGVFWLIIFTKKLFFPSYHFAHVLFHVTFWGKNAPEKKKTTLVWTLDPKEKKLIIWRNKMQS